VLRIPGAPGEAGQVDFAGVCRAGRRAGPSKTCDDRKIAGKKQAHLCCCRKAAVILVGMIRHGCAVASRRPAPGAKSNGATVSDQYDTADN